MQVLEHIDRRVLGALRLVDAPSEALIRGPMSVQAEGAQFVRNRSGLYVITRAPGLEHHAQAFEEPPDDPPNASVELEVTVTDPAGDYLPRAVSVALPLDSDPEHVDEEASLFRPIDVVMYSAPKAQIVANRSAVRASVWQVGAGNGRRSIPGALLRVVREEDEQVLARGLTDTRGEGLVCITGIPITSFATGNSKGKKKKDGEEDGDEDNGSPVTSITPTRLEVIVHPDLPWPVNPDVLETNRDLWWRNRDSEVVLEMRTGDVLTVSVEVELSDGP